MEPYGLLPLDSEVDAAEVHEYRERLDEVRSNRFIDENLGYHETYRPCSPSSYSGYDQTYLPINIQFGNDRRWHGKRLSE